MVDDGTATMEFVAQLARGERLVRWHRKGGRRGPPRPGLRAGLRRGPPPAHARAARAGSRCSARCRRRTPPHGRDGRAPTASPGPGPASARRASPRAPTWSAPRWSRRAWSTPSATWTAVGAPGPRPRRHAATSPTAARAPEKLHRLAAETGLEIVRPDLPLELVARRGPIGRTVLSFPSTVVHTLPLALAGTGVRVAVCDIDPAWLTAGASPRAQGFLSGVTGTARAVPTGGEPGGPATRAAVTRGGRRRVRRPPVARVAGPARGDDPIDPERGSCIPARGRKSGPRRVYPPPTAAMRRAADFSSPDGLKFC